MFKHVKKTKIIIFMALVLSFSSLSAQEKCIKPKAACEGASTSQIAWTTTGIILFIVVGTIISYTILKD